YLIRSQKAPISLANCRILGKQSNWAGIRANDSPRCEVVNCQFLGENIAGMLDWACPARGKAVLRNCQKLGGPYWLALHYQRPPEDVTIELSRNTVLVREPIA